MSLLRAMPAEFRARTLIAALAVAACAGGAARPADEVRAPWERSVVGLNITFQTWDEDRPWSKKKPENRRASGVLVGPNLVLTAAENLSHAAFIQLEALGRTRQDRMKIERLDRSVNLALLSSAGETLGGLAPVSVAARTPSSGTLRTVRWRGQQLEAAASRVIRFEVERSATGNAHHAFLKMRTDMAGGGWSEPVFDGAELAGLAVSQNADESRAIPAEIVGAFLGRSQGPGDSEGFPTLGANWQVSKEHAVSRFLRQEGEPRGILIRQVPWGSTGCGVLKPRDILLELDGESIDAEGFTNHAWLGRLGFNHILAERFRPGDVVTARVHRDGREQEVKLTARTYPAALNLVPPHQLEPPPYLVAGGLVFRELDVPYLRTWGKEWTRDAPDRLLSRYFFNGEGQTAPLRRIVLISAVLPSAYNVGYHDLRDVVVERVNGRAIGRIEDVAAALAAPRDGVHVIDLARESPTGQIVLDAGTLGQATAQILEDYGIPSDRRLREAPLPEGAGECPGDY